MQSTDSGGGGLTVDGADIAAAIGRFSDIQVRMSTLLTWVTERITGLPPGNDDVTRTLHGAFTHRGSSTVQTTVDAFANKLSGAGPVLVSVSESYAQTDTQNAYVTAAAAGASNLVQSALNGESALSFTEA